MAASDYRFAPLQLARFVGGLLVALAVLVFVGTFAVAVLGLSLGALALVTVVVVVAVVALIWWLRSVVVVRFDETGYRTRLMHGAGVTQAAWGDVREASTATVAGAPVVLLTLADGRRTTIPVSVLAVDQEQFVRDLQSHLQSGQRLRAWE